MNGDATNFRSVQDLLDAFYGGSFVTQPEETSYTIGAAAARIGGQLNGIRISVVLSNCGTSNLFVSFDAGVTATTGIAIAPKANYRFDWYYDGDLVSRPLYVISDAGGGKLHMLERFITGA